MKELLEISPIDGRYREKVQEIDNVLLDMSKDFWHYIENLFLV